MIFDFMNGDLSYDAAAVVRNTHDHMLWILAACAISFIGAYMQYFGTISMGFKHRTHSIPLVGNVLFFAHDTSFVSNHQHWFYEVDFWLVAIGNIAICFASITEFLRLPAFKPDFAKRSIEH